MGLVQGVGIYRKGPYQSKHGKTRTREYELWRGVLKRCYDESSLLKCPTYRGCEVIGEFLDFQYFAEWCNKRQDFIRGWHLDKDILVRNNKIYSPNTCCFVPPDVNMLLTKRKALRGNSPIGVTYHINQKKYNSRLMVEGRKINLGSFDDLEEAFGVYKLAKEIQIKAVADKFRQVLVPDVYNALYRYEVRRDD